MQQRLFVKKKVP